jgi:short-subunit dehydrogenase
MLTGASRGIGPYIAQELADQRMNLLLVALSEPGLDEIASTIRSRGGRAVAIPIDVGNRQALEALVARAKSEFPTIDLLVNNASLEMFFPFHRLQHEDIERIICVNLTGAILLSRMILPDMLARRSGHIVNVSSLTAKGGPPCSEPYVATKAGLIAFTKSLRAEYRGTGVSASVIVPGFVKAGMYQRLFEETGLAAPRLFLTAPEAVAQAVVRAVKGDVPELIINPGPMRLLTALGEFSPSLAEFVIRVSGVADWFRQVANAREGRTDHKDVIGHADD